MPTLHKGKPKRVLRIRRPFAKDDGVEGTGAASAGPGSDDEDDTDTENGDQEPQEEPPPMPILDKAEREVNRLKMLRETLGPVQSRDEFCKRFNVGEAQYRASRDVFQKLAGDKDFVTDTEWLEDAPQTEAAQQWVRNIWRAFAPADNKMTLSEWLVFDGIRKYGTLDQRVVGSFVLYDHNADGVLQREEVASMMRTAAAVAGEGISESLIQQALELLMQAADKSHVCCFIDFCSSEPPPLPLFGGFAEQLLIVSCIAPMFHWLGVVCFLGRKLLYCNTPIFVYRFYNRLVSWSLMIFSVLLE